MKSLLRYVSNVRFLGYHSDGFETFYLLGCQQTFRGNISAASSGLPYSSTLNLEAVRSSEMSADTRTENSGRPKSSGTTGWESVMCRTTWSMFACRDWTQFVPRDALEMGVSLSTDRYPVLPSDNRFLSQDYKI
jgi:hypothetical protein